MGDSALVQSRLPCPHCGSSDAYATYDDGHGHCFSCNTTDKDAHGRNDAAAVDRPDHRQRTRVGGSVGARPMIPFGEYRSLDKRKITAETCRKYGYFVGEMNGKPVQVAPYHDAAGKVVAQKVRFPSKDFTVTGDLKQATLFGQHLWRTGGKRVVVTEGEIDCLSVAQALNLNWPVVSVPNGAAGAKKAIQANLEWLESYEAVVFMFDMDEPGRKASKECADLLQPGKAAVASLPMKDPNEMLQAGMVKELVKAVWEANEVRPDGVVKGSELWERVKTPIQPGIMFPWRGVNELTYGMRPGEVIVHTAGTGVGKSTVVAEIGYDLAVAKGETVGVIMLEESVERAARRFMGIHLDMPLHLPVHTATEAQLREAFDATLATNRLHFLDHFGSLESETLLSRMRYMTKGLGCRHVILDHVSMVASGADLNEDERRLLDNLMTQLKVLGMETGAVIHAISHLSRPEGSKGHEDGAQVAIKQLRGSHAIGQLADTILGYERDSQAEEEADRNTTSIRVLKARATGMTGPAAKLHYSRSTGRLLEDAMAAVPQHEGPTDAHAHDDEIPF